MASPETTPILLALPSLTPSLALEVLPYGLTIHRFFVQADGRTHDLVIGPESPHTHKHIKYTNTIIGRYANRLPVKELSVSSSRSPEIQASFTPLPNETPNVSLHGGQVGFDEKFWEPTPVPPGPGEAELFSGKELSTIESGVATAALFKYISEDGEQGYPGKLRVEVLVGLLQPDPLRASDPGEFNLGSVLIVYRAKLLEEGKVTPINLTQHTGYNLDASVDQKVMPIHDHTLTIKGNKTVELHPDMVATGQLTSHDSSSPYHFLNHTRIGSRYPEGGYDNFFVFDQTGEQIVKIFKETELLDADLVHEIIKPVPGKPAEPKVVLQGSQSGVKLSFATNQSGVQYYSNSLSDGSGFKKKIHGGDGRDEKKPGGGYDKGCATFLEFHEPYPSFLYPGLSPSGYDTLLTSGEIYNNYLRIDVGYTPRPSASS
ncbi:galactose mutarotase-like protein [Thelephora ganbajun]|uniref:Galactose mutarotase-like protein n=1 Tax=Thelephora ganbajun TaxID=370292 RepID=A0ACB6ZDP6_THEGA|nr:galactose mutarotase-like protein [Thelephora ganbajun]